MITQLEISLEHIAALLDMLLNAAASEDRKLGFVLVVSEHLLNDDKHIDTSVMSNMPPDIAAVILLRAGEAAATRKEGDETEH